MHITSKKGFTLIELLIVVAIIGLLASVVLVGLGPTQRAGRDARRVADLKSVQTALELYYQKNGSYPAAQANWGAFLGVLDDAGVFSNITLNDPRGGTNTYLYAPTSDGKSYLLGAQLEDSGNKLMSSSAGSSAGGFTIGNTTFLCGTDGYYCVVNF